MIRHKIVTGVTCGALALGAPAYSLYFPAALAAGKPSPAPGHLRAAVPRHAPDRLLVRFAESAGAGAVVRAHGRAGGQKLRELRGIGVQVVSVPPGRLQAALRAYRADPAVEYVEPDAYRVVFIPNEGDDPGPAAGGIVAGRDYFEEQWGLHNTGQQHTFSTSLGATQVTGIPDADIDMPAAWDITTGAPSVKIAVLDTGIDCASVEHAGKCVEELSFVGAFSDYGSDPGDYVGHGTHVAGIAAVHTDNQIGVAGVGWNASLGNLKTCFAYQLDQFPPLGIYVTVGVCPVSASAAAIEYAADNGYHVINMSYASDQLDGGGDPDGVPAQPNTETAAIRYAWEQGAVLVAAAGNGNSADRVYPAANADVIAVAATNRFDDRAAFSSFSTVGDHWVSMMAPGENILSTIPVAECTFIAQLLGYPFDPTTEGCLTWQSGTSMASPHVAGAAALVWSHLFPGQVPSTCASPAGVPCNQVVRSHLVYGADATGAGTQNMLAWSRYGRLNVHGALTVADANLDGVVDGSSPDSDGDGLPDPLEISIGSNPFNPDTDNDTLDDAAEVNYSTPPHDTYTPGLDTDPLSADTDGDGHDDGDEIAAGRDPLDPADHPLPPGC